MTEPTDVRTLAEAAELLGVHYMTAYRYVRTGRLDATKVGRAWVVRVADLERLAARSSSPADDGADGDDARRSGRRWRSAADRIEARLLVGDEAGAWAVVEEALAGGHPAEDVLLQVIAPAITSVGEGWHRGEISIAEEHQFTSLVTRLVGRLGPRFARRGPSRGTVVLGAPAGDHHALPTAIVRDLLRGRGFDVVDLGANVPAASWAEVVARTSAAAPPLVAVGVAATTADNDAAVVAAIAAIRSVATVPVVLGGAAVAGPTGRSFDADCVTASATAAVDAIVELAASQPTN